ncbi:MAG: hypothetical protein E6883_11610 [Lactococcus lactis]|nr:hypothetical protein [Lactococcus lactis]MDU3960791.1 hypothetical protein [Lactococcus lactis]MDU4038131.1 hypothetical protein [Lactococcus lactis]MDU4518419.1 hypothetical protein [Lactococcus lactis]
MNPRISKLFEEIDELEEELEYYSKRDMCHQAHFKRYQIVIRRDFIKKISNALNPQIPEPWASMSADEIIKGLGVYI